MYKKRSFPVTIAQTGKRTDTPLDTLRYRQRLGLLPAVDSVSRMADGLNLQDVC